MSMGDSVNCAQKSGLKALLKMVYSRMAKGEEAKGDEDEEETKIASSEEKPKIEVVAEDGDDASDELDEVHDKIREMFNGPKRKPAGFMVSMKKEEVVPMKASVKTDRMAAARAAKAAKRKV